MNSLIVLKFYSITRYRTGYTLYKLQNYIFFFKLSIFIRFFFHIVGGYVKINMTTCLAMVLHYLKNKKRRNPNCLELRLDIIVLAILLHFNCLCHCSLFLLDLATESDVSYRSSDEDRRECTEDYTEQHSE